MIILLIISFVNLISVLFDLIIPLILQSYFIFDLVFFFILLKVHLFLLSANYLVMIILFVHPSNFYLPLALHSTQYPFLFQSLLLLTNS